MNLSRIALFLAMAGLGMFLIVPVYWSGKENSKPGPGCSEEISRRCPDVETRWASFENRLALKGAGATENRGVKGHPFESLGAGETKTLLQVEGSGEIRRMWFTLDSRDPETLRSLRLEIFWDEASTPAVSVPFGDFFAAILGRTVAFENALFASPEGRSFVCYIPMPFRRGASVRLTNDSTHRVTYVFYDIDVLKTEQWNPDSLYFHATWRRERPTTLLHEFEILPKVEGEGRFIGAHIGVITHPENTGWWGEGTVKVYLDGDTNPTLAGTGTEDYIGTGWGQGVFVGRFQGSLVSDPQRGEFGFYRYHLPDPIYFHHDLRATISQLGGENRSRVLGMLKKGVPITPTSMDDRGKWIKLLDSPQRQLGSYDTTSSDPGVVYARQDDVSAVAFYYLDSPHNKLPPLAQVSERVSGLPKISQGAQ
ncbi:MAG: DUF2961 domain-containing protein [Acidobacteria bacterium]|nr:DUF2961 domain-containing protein [Acidobacteriota bacterium]